MSNPQLKIKEIRNSVIKGLVWQYLPLFIIGLIIPWLETLPLGLQSLITFPSLISFFYGYIVCFKVAEKYAKYKGYKNYYYIYSFLNFFGLSILFLLTNRNPSNNRELEQEPLLNFSILSIFTSWFVTPIALTPLSYLIALCIAGIEGFEEYTEKNEDFSAISAIPILIIFTWYVIREFKRVNIDYKFILGTLKRINFNLVIEITIIKYLFAQGINPITLYGLSFIVPKYVEYEINHKDATTTFGWICFAIIALLFAPLMEEFLYRGIIFQKLAIQKNIIKGLVISAIAFAIIHFRYDVIPLFVFGVISVILYLKTKQLAVSIIFHFAYNFIVTVRNIYHQSSGREDESIFLKS